MVLQLLHLLIYNYTESTGSKFGVGIWCKKTVVVFTDRMIKENEEDLQDTSVLVHWLFVVEFSGDWWILLAYTLSVLIV